MKMREVDARPQTRKFDQELANAKRFARQHYQGLDSDEAFDKWVQRSLKHSEEDDRYQDQKIDNLVQQISDLHAEVQSLKKDHQKLGLKESLINQPFKNPIALLRHKLDRLEDPNYDKIDLIMKRIANRQGIGADMLHKMWVDKYKKTPDEYCGCAEVKEDDPGGPIVDPNEPNTVVGKFLRKYTPIGDVDDVVQGVRQGNIKQAAGGALGLGLNAISGPARAAGAAGLTGARLAGVLENKPRRKANEVSLSGVSRIPAAVPDTDVTKVDPSILKGIPDAQKKLMLQPFDKMQPANPSREQMKQQYGSDRVLRKSNYDGKDDDSTDTNI